MSRTSKALKRLGVAGVAVATIGAGVPAFFVATAASANHTTTAISLTPDSDQAATGTCNQFTATVTFSGANNTTDTAIVDVTADPRAQDQDVDFCDLNAAGTQTGASQGNVVTGAGAGVGAGQTENAEFLVTESNNGSNTGSVTFGIISQQAGLVDVIAFLENTGAGTFVNQPGANAPDQTATGNGVADGTELRDQSLKEFTPGGQTAVAANPNGLDASPESAVNVQGDQHTFTAVLTDSAGRPLPGITNVKFDITAGPDASQTTAIAPTTPTGNDSQRAAGANTTDVRQCTTTDQTGTTTCRFTNNGGPGTDNITVFLDRNNDNVADAAEPQDQITKSFQAPQPAGTTVTLTCASTRTNLAGDNCQNPLTETSEVFTATVRNSANQPVANVPVAFEVTSGASPDAPNTPASQSDNEVVTPTTCTTGADGTCTTTLRNPRPTEDETFVVTAFVGVSSTSGSNAGCTSAQQRANTVCDQAIKVFRTPDPNEARNITLDPPTQNAQVGSVATLVATVTDRFGGPVPGVSVRFTEGPSGTQAGTGRFINGSSEIYIDTDANGQARAELTTTSTEQAGSTTVTATIFGGRFFTGPNFSNAIDDECESAATGNRGGTGAAPNQTAGNCNDSSVINFTAQPQTATPTATATNQPTGQPTGQPSTPPGCATANNNLQVRVNTPTINATGLASVTVTGAAPGQVIELQGYSQNHFGTRNFANDPTPVDRTAVADSNGSATFSDLRPASNTRVRARQRGCAFGNIGAVINVRTQITLQVVRNGVRTYTFSGRTIPAREGGLIVTLYRGASEVLFRQTRATAGSDVQPQPAGAGLYSITVTFPAREANTTQRFVVKTGQDAQNAPGRSNVRLLRVF